MIFAICCTFVVLLFNLIRDNPHRVLIRVLLSDLFSFNGNACYDFDINFFEQFFIEFLISEFPVFESELFSRAVF